VFLQVSAQQEGGEKEKERLRLKHMSEERVSKWPNTLQVSITQQQTSVVHLDPGSVLLSSKV
jgi:hypothetical protein